MHGVFQPIQHSNICNPSAHVLQWLWSERRRLPVGEGKEKELMYYLPDRTLPSQVETVPFIRRREEMGYNIPADHGGPLPRGQREELFNTKKELQERSTLSGQPSHARGQDAPPQLHARVSAPGSVKDKVTKHLSDAHKSLMEAHMAAITANPLAGDVPAFQKMQGLAKELSALMLEVNKLRGL